MYIYLYSQGSVVCLWILSQVWIILASSSSTRFWLLLSTYFSTRVWIGFVPKRVFLSLKPRCLGRVKHFEIWLRPQHLGELRSSSSPHSDGLIKVGVKDADESFRHGDDGNELISLTFHHHFLLSKRSLSFFSIILNSLITHCRIILCSNFPAKVREDIWSFFHFLWNILQSDGCSLFNQKIELLTNGRLMQLMFIYASKHEYR